LSKEERQSLIKKVIAKKVDKMKSNGFRFKETEETNNSD
jgi:hypothetical protein